MSDNPDQEGAKDIDLARRRAMWRALGGAPVILTLSSTRAWASHKYGHYKGPCDLPDQANETAEDNVCPD